MTTSIQTSLDLGTVLPRLERNDHNAAGMLLQQPPSISLSPQLVARFYSDDTQVTHEQLDEVGIGVLHLWDHAAENLVEQCGDGTTIKLKMRNAGVLVGLDVVGCQVSLGVDKRGEQVEPTTLVTHPHTFDALDRHMRALLRAEPTYYAPTPQVLLAVHPRTDVATLQVWLAATEVTLTATPFTCLYGYPRPVRLQ